MEMEKYWEKNPRQSENCTGDVPRAVSGRPGKGHVFPASYNLAFCFFWQDERKKETLG